MTLSFLSWGLTWWRVERWRPVLENADLPLPPLTQEAPITVLKPLHGLEPELDKNLRSFCDQDYGHFRIYCGVQDPADPVLGVLAAAQQQASSCPLQVVVHDTMMGSNPKVANLAGIALGVAAQGPSNEADIWVLNDADIRVGPNYLRHQVQGLEQEGVGVVTCLYRPLVRGPFWSAVLAAQIQESFLPSVLLADGLGSHLYCAGASIALRRRELEAWGGFGVLADTLADDFAIGALARNHGWEVFLSPYVVDTLVSEPSFASFYAHALRWARTTRAVQPAGHALAFLIYPLPMAILLAPFLGWVGLAVVGLVLALRLMYHLRIVHKLQSPMSFWAALLGDALGLWIWGHAQLAGRVTWRGRKYTVDPLGRMQ